MREDTREFDRISSLGDDVFAVDRLALSVRFHSREARTWKEFRLLVELSIGAVL
jgi:hypothetical protein